MIIKGKKIFIDTINFLERQVNKVNDTVYSGSVVTTQGLILLVSGINLPIGSLCYIQNKKKKHFYRKIFEVVGFKKNVMFVIPLDGTISGICSGDRVFPIISESKEKNSFLEQQFPIGENMLGRVLDSRGNTIDGLGKFVPDLQDSIINTTINPMFRKPINSILDVGIRSINSLFTIGLGQRIGLFSTSGIGKSVLLGMITKYCSSDVVVIGLIGERSREIKEFIDNVLGPVGISKSVIVAEPAGSSPLLRIQGAMYATRIAEYFRDDKKKNVLLIIDSLTRYAMSLREIALSMGELPVSKGYPVSVFSKLSHLLERAGNSSLESGSMSAIYTVLTEEDEGNDPISDISKSTLDGHLVLSKEQAKLGIYPAIDIESSISRVMTGLVSNKHYSYMLQFKQLMSIYKKNKELINIGAYVSGTDSVIDESINKYERLNFFLQQSINTSFNFLNSIKELENLFKN
ncbi:Flagellum-specific ATP synthase [Buchnera aphidicola (Tetraneura ulmi)]|uniref:FliI/YscN family ATPase n=1 Tax=Buchnera aphidicola TaxID=9 RepID=UPI0034639DC6